jgi:hypothetical protein
MSNDNVGRDLIACGYHAGLRSFAECLRQSLQRNQGTSPIVHLMNALAEAEVRSEKVIDATMNEFLAEMTSFEKRATE